MGEQIVTGYAKMWPREVFDIRAKGNKFLPVIKERLKEPGVYVLYKNDQPYYFGRTRGSLFKRIRNHAVRPGDAYYNFWISFSAFAVPQASHIGEVEAILIAGTHSANRANPKIRRIQFPTGVGKILYKRRQIDLDSVSVRKKQSRHSAQGRKMRS